MVMLLTIVPMFASMYDSMNAQLPFVTQILVDLGKVMPYVLPMLIVAVVALAMFWKRNRNKDIIRTWWDPFTLKAPVFGKLDTNVALARFCNNFSSMLASGVPILQALDIVGSTSGNYVIDSSSKRVGRLVERGYRLADSMSTEKIFRTCWCRWWPLARTPAPSTKCCPVRAERMTKRPNPWPNSSPRCWNR